MKDSFFCVAKTFAGLEEVLEQELTTAGASQTRMLTRAVSFQADTETLYRICWNVRTAIRILRRIRKFNAGKDNIYYHQIRKINWNKLIGLDQTFLVDGVAHSNVFTHSQYLAQKTKDGIVDRIRNDQGARPSVDKNQPDIRIHVHVYENQCQVFLDAGGENLFKRGFERKAGKAPLNEVLAAGLLMISDWNKKEPLLDPMCGSGTFLREGAALALGISPYQANRSFGVEKWPSFNSDLWEKARKEAFQTTASLPPLYGSDNNPESIQLSQYNLEKAGLLDHVQLTRQPFNECVAPAGSGMIIMNPPYDERIPLEDSRAFYKNIGDHLKQAFAGWRAWIFSANLKGIKAVGLKPYAKNILYNGPLKSRYHAFEMYAGSRET